MTDKEKEKAAQDANESVTLESFVNNLTMRIFFSKRSQKGQNCPPTLLDTEITILT